MQLQTADPHDAIAAQLRDLAPRRALDASESNEIPAPSQVSASEPSLGAVPLNDNTDDIRIPASGGRSGLAAILLAVFAGVVATMVWHSYGDEAKQRLSHLVPQLLAYAPMVMQGIGAGPKDAASQTGPSLAAAAQPAAAPASAQEASVESATPTSSASAPAAVTPAETPPAQAAVPAELMQSVEAMTHEIDSLKQTVQQLQAGQQQLSHDVAKLGEHGTRHRVSAQTPKPAPRPTPRRPSTPAANSQALARYSARYSPPPAPSQRPTYPQGYSQSAVQRDAYIPPPAPPRLPPPPGDSSVPRPPMPLQ
jgi:hypothetical protein